MQLLQECYRTVKDACKDPLGSYQGTTTSVSLLLPSHCTDGCNCNFSTGLLAPAYQFQKVVPETELCKHHWVPGRYDLASE